MEPKQETLPTIEPKPETKAESKPDPMADILAKQAETIAKLESKLKARESKEKADEDRKRAETGDAAKVIAEKDEALARYQKQLEAFETREKERIAKALEGLPEVSRTKLEKFRERMSAADFAELVDAEAGSIIKPEAKPLLPPTGAPMPKGNAKGYTPTPEAQKILDSMMKGADMLSALSVTKSADSESGHTVTKFSLPMREFFDRMNLRQVDKLNRDNAHQRDEQRRR